MTQQHGPAGRGSHTVIPADPLSRVIADAFFPRDVCQWLVPDEAARRQIFPAYFRMYVEHAMADGLADPASDRAAAALAPPAAPGGPGPAGEEPVTRSRARGEAAPQRHAFGWCQRCLMES